jgi:hypothetical protein
MANGINLVDLSKYTPQNLKNPLSQNFNEGINFNNTSFFSKVTKTKWNLNKIVLTAFIVFSIFFLYNCKYGIFKYPNPQLFQ